MILAATAGCAGVSDSSGASTKAGDGGCEATGVGQSGDAGLVDLDRWHGDGIVAGAPGLWCRGPGCATVSRPCRRTRGALSPSSTSTEGAADWRPAKMLVTSG